MQTPWGLADDVSDLGAGIELVSTPSHGGIRLTGEARSAIPADVADAMLTPATPDVLWAEEDCEVAIVLTVLGFRVDDAKARMALAEDWHEQCLRHAALVVHRYEEYSSLEPHMRRSVCGACDRVIDAGDERRNDAGEVLCGTCGDVCEPA